MMELKKVPNRDDLVDYTYAVAGHAGAMCDADGELFIKPCTQAELDFYQDAVQYHSEFADLMPVFVGSLMLNDAVAAGAIAQQLPAAVDPETRAQVAEMVAEKTQQQQQLRLVTEAAPAPAPPAAAVVSPVDNVTWVPSNNKKIKTDRAVVLENTTFGFKRPNIMDVKLGVRLWADNAPLQKKRRFDEITAETTHRDYGFRVSGMRVWRGSEDEAELDGDDYRIYDKDWGRVSVNNGNVADSLRRFIFNPAAGIDEETGRMLADAFKRDLEHVRDVMQAEESRMYSASLLFVFEGDGVALRAAVDETSASATASYKDKCAGGDASLSKYRVDSGIDMGEDGEMIGLPGVGKGGAVVALDDDEDDDERDEPRVYSLKLIDFAHAEFTPGRGPDENVLKGIRSLIQLFDDMSR